MLNLLFTRGLRATTRTPMSTALTVILQHGAVSSRGLAQSSRLTMQDYENARKAAKGDLKPFFEAYPIGANVPFYAEVAKEQCGGDRSKFPKQFAYQLSWFELHPIVKTI